VFTVPSTLTSKTLRHSGAVVSRSACSPPRCRPVDEHVHGADLAGCPAERRLVGHVRDEVDRPADIQGRHRETFGAQPLSGRRAEPARATGHQAILGMVDSPPR